jgi:glycosyltransferase involved in cell wall biosynthesis
LLADGENALLVPPGDPGALAEALRRLAADGRLSQRIAAAGRAAYERSASEAVLGARWRKLLEDLV